MNRQVSWIIALMLSTMATGWAADGMVPTRTMAVISGPESVAAGELVKLQARLVYQRQWLRIEGSEPKNRPRFRWELANPPDGYNAEEWTFNDGRTCVFATGRPGLYQFILAGTQLDAEGIPRLFIVRHTLTVEPSNPPGPEPNPDPPEPKPPEPDLPAGRFGLARLVYQLAGNQVPAAHRAAAGALAENYRGIAARIAAGTLTGVPEILTETTAGNQRAVGTGREAWMPFFEQLAGRMRELDRAGELTSSEDFQQAWTEIAMGLDAVHSRRAHADGIPQIAPPGA